MLCRRPRRAVAAPDVSLRGSVRFHREDYRSTYLAYNPVTGQYGYVSENGSQGSVVAGEVGIFDPRLDPARRRACEVFRSIRKRPMSKAASTGV